jgi:hypothetical protein
MENKKTHWLSSPNKNYLGHWDLPENKDLILTIKSGGYEMVKNPTNGKTTEKKVVHFAEKNTKPLICNMTNSLNITLSTGKRFIEDTIGCKIALFVGEYVNRVTKETEDCVRVRRTEVSVKKPEFTEANFEKAKNAGATIEKIKSIYYISEENITKYTEYATEK